MKILRLPAVCEMLGLSRAAIHDRIADGVFPKPIKLGGGTASAWVEEEIQAWLRAQVAKRDNGGEVVAKDPEKRGRGRPKKDVEVTA